MRPRTVDTMRDINMPEKVFPPGTHHPTDQNLRLCWFLHILLNMLGHTAVLPAHLSILTCPCFPFKGSFCYSWQSPLSPCWCTNTCNSHMFSFPAWGAGGPAFPQTCTWRWGCMLHLTRRHRPRCQGLCSVLNKRFLLKCLVPTRSITPMIPSVWMCNPRPDWLTNTSQLELKLSN